MRGVVGRRSREIGRVGLRREKESGSQVGAGIYAMQPYWAVNDAPRHFGSCSCQNTSISFVAEKLSVYFSPAPSHARKERMPSCLVPA
jgi:hypothetical protein